MNYSILDPVLKNDVPFVTFPHMQVLYNNVNNVVDASF